MFWSSFFFSPPPPSCGMLACCLCVCVRAEAMLDNHRLVILYSLSLGALLIFIQLFCIPHVLLLASFFFFVRSLRRRSGGREADEVFFCFVCLFHFIYFGCARHPRSHRDSHTPRTLAHSHTERHTGARTRSRSKSSSFVLAALPPL